MRPKTLVPLLLLLALVPLARVTAQPRSGARAPAVVRGIVMDASTDALLAGATAELVGESAGPALSDERGNFRLLHPGDGPAVLHVKRLGYEPAMVVVRPTVGDSLVVLVELHARAPTLDTVRVRAAGGASSPRLADFERRRQSGRGTFITRAEIEARDPRSTSDLLRRVTTVAVQEKGLETRVFSSRGMKLTSTQGVECPLRIAVDGVVKEESFAVNTISPREIHGIEVYAGPATIPAQFLSGARADAFCGLIVLWTRVE